MPSGVFKPYAGVSTAILVFTKTNSGGTDHVWFYDMQSDGFSLVRYDTADDSIRVIRGTWDNYGRPLITPDGQRTMQTYLGACTELSVDDVTRDTVGEPAIILLEGYIWDLAEGPAAAEKAMEFAEASSSRIALSLSDSFCVQRHRDAFHDAVRNGVDIVVAPDIGGTPVGRPVGGKHQLERAARIGDRERPARAVGHAASGVQAELMTCIQKRPDDIKPNSVKVGMA